VRTNSIYKPEQGDAAVIRIKGSGGRAVAITSDVNPLYCYLDPFEGGKQAVAEAARNVACSGGEPVAITDCLNFGNPERPEIMWQFAECVRGISEACRELETPVVSGNVSLYNETEGSGIYPTPTVGMVGIIEDESRAVGLAFPDAGLRIVLLGQTNNELGGSEYAQMFHSDQLAAAPRVDLKKEKQLIDLLVHSARERWSRSAHDLSNGGLAVALAECAMKGVGCEVDLTGYADELDATTVLFSESQGRALLTASEENAVKIVARAQKNGLTARIIGTTTHAAFLVLRNGVPLVKTTTPELHRIWSEAFPKHLAGDSIAEIIEGRGDVAEDVIPVS
jgi:phosphoribosylformylglycinamidine synthase